MYLENWICVFFISMNKVYYIIRENYLFEIYFFRRYIGKMDFLSFCFNFKYEFFSFKSY